MKLKTMIKQLCSGEVKFINCDSMSAEILLPYETTSIFIDLEGDTVVEKADSFVSGVNHRIDEMINHLEDSKLS